MKIYYRWFSLALLIVSLPLWAEFSAPSAKASIGYLDPRIEIQNSLCSPLATALLAVSAESHDCIQLNNKSLASDSDLALADFSGSTEFSTNNPPLIPLRANALLFQHNLQTKPIYWSIAEFNPPDLALFRTAELCFKQDDSPWFMQSNQKSSSRLSGWKDGNSLYSACITYH